VFFFFECTVPIDISNKTRIVYRIEGNIDFLFEMVGISEGGKVLRVGYKRRRAWSHEWSGF
jgi:hypothetical protein